MAAPTHVDASGRIIATGLPAQHPGFKVNIQGGLLEHGAATTAKSIAQQAAHAQKAGVTMRGGGLTEVKPMPNLSGSTIPGINVNSNNAKLLSSLNGLRTAGVYDNLGSAQPYKVKLGGKRKKRQSHTKRNKKNKHGRHNSHRNIKRGGRKHITRTRRNSNFKR
jgi:hypothetical protein